MFEGGMGGRHAGTRTASGFERTPNLMLPFAAAVLMAWEKLPLSLRSTSEMIQLSEMLKIKVADGAERSEKIFGLEWNKLVWSEEGEIKNLTKGSLDGKAFEGLDREPVIAFLLHRWANNLMTSDCLSPNHLSTSFFDELSDFKADAEGGVDGRSYLVKRASNWNPKPLLDLLKRPYVSINFNGESESFKGDNCTQIAQLSSYRGFENISDISDKFLVKILFELEPEGWRISKMTRFNDGEEVAVFAY